MVFDSFSFISGILTGLIVRWTDIIPIVGGFVLGLSVKKMPEIININDLPPFVQKYINYFIVSSPKTETLNNGVSVKDITESEENRLSLIQQIIKSR